MTGVPAATLRAWERRYGIPSPQRTDSSYRLYSDHDVELINRVKEHCDEGMAPSQAAELVRRMVKADDPTAGAPTDSWTIARDRIIEAVRVFDPAGLEMAVRASMMLGSARTIFDRVFAPALRIIGDEWHAGALSVAQEHLASEQLGNASRELLRLVQPTAPLRQVVLACVADEYHAMPLYGTALHFVQWGYHVVILGVNTPPEALAHAVATLQPHAVGLSSTQMKPAAQFAELMAAYAAACEGIAWVVGGSAATAHGALVTAAGGLLAKLGDDPAEVRERLEARYRVLRSDD